MQLGLIKTLKFNFQCKQLLVAENRYFPKMSDFLPGMSLEAKNEFYTLKLVPPSKYQLIRSSFQIDVEVLNQSFTKITIS